MNAKTAKLLKRATQLNGENYHNTKKLWLRLPAGERCALRNLMRAEVERARVK
jgi:hypothetical protein